MTIKITVEGDTLADAIANMETALEALQSAAASTAEPEGKPAAKAKPAAAKAKPKAPEPEPDDDAVVYDTDIRPHIVALSKDGGREVAMEVLGQFTNAVDDEPCTKGTEVSEGDWVKFLVAIKKARVANDLEISDELTDAIAKVKAAA